MMRLGREVTIGDLKNYGKELPKDMLMLSGRAVRVVGVRKDIQTGEKEFTIDRDRGKNIWREDMFLTV